MTKMKTLCAALLLSAASTSLLAQSLTVSDAWARATVQGQKATGAFMTLTSPTGGVLLSVSTPVAGVAEIHEMKMEGDVMQMRPLAGGLEIPAGTPVALRPGSYHLMLMDLKLPLKKDSSIPLTLVFKDAKGKQSSTELKLPVLLNAPAAMAH